MIGWNMLFFQEGRFRPDASKSADWNRGAYLVQGAGHCGACHTAKNLLGSDKSSEAFEGGVLQGWFAPNLTGDMRKGLGGWSVEDVVAYLKTGLNHNATATGPMAEVVSLSTSRMRTEDLRAMAIYLKDIAAKPQQAQPLAASDPAMQRGKAVFDASCSACHEGDGTGVPNLFPALAGAPNVQSTDITGLARVVLEGARGVATDAKPTSGAMPSFAWKYSDEDIAAALTYIRNSWGNAAPLVTASDIRKERNQLAQAPQ
jgi:mono/diheme cytochrome c family protein